MIPLYALIAATSAARGVGALGLIAPATRVAMLTS